MRVIKDLQVPQNTDRNKFPWGHIRNESETEEGTPVVEEIYGDVLSNIYKILDDAGIEPNNAQDSEQTGYQLLKAFKRFTNELNDVEHVVSLSGTSWSVNLNIEKLPNKYVMICRMDSAYQSGVDYTFRGTTSTNYPLTSPTGFNASDEVILVIDQAGVRVYSLGAVSSVAASGVFPVFGNPVAFCDNDTLYYQSSGNLLTDAPSVNNIQQQIRLAESNSTLYVNEVFVLQGKVLCVVYDTAAVTYRLFQFAINDLENPSEVALSGGSFPTGTNNNPYLYCDGEYLYITNATGNSVNDYVLDKYTYNPDTANLTFVSSVNLDVSFAKSTNVVVKGDLVSFVAGELAKFNLSTGSQTILGNYNTILGIIFHYKGEVYYTNGEVAKKWTV